MSFFDTDTIMTSKDFAEILLTILKFTAITLSGVYGVIGIVVDYKDSSGQVTKWGKRALIGVIGSSVIAILSTGAELYIKKIDDRNTSIETLNEIKRSERTLKEIQRIISPIENVDFTVWVNATNTIQELDDYRKDFSEAIPDFLNFFDNKKSNDDIIDNGVLSVNSSSQDSNGNSTLISLSPSENSFLEPKVQNPKDTKDFVFGHLGISLAVFENHIDPKMFRMLYTPESPRPDLQLNSKADYSKVVYDLGDKSFELEGWNMKSDPEFWNSQGNIKSILDLRGTQLLFFLDRGYGSNDDDINSQVYQARKKLEIETILFSIDNEDFWFRKEHLKLYKDVNGFPLYEFIVPDSMQEFKESLKRGL